MKACEHDRFIADGGNGCRYDSMTAAIGLADLEAIVAEACPKELLLQQGAMLADVALAQQVLHRIADALARDRRRFLIQKARKELAELQAEEAAAIEKIEMP